MRRLSVAGRSDELGPGEQLPGVELLDVRTVREDGPRLIGNVAIEVSFDGVGERVLAGFENHGGRTRLAADQAPLGRVLTGYGNDGRSGFEGAGAATSSAPTCMAPGARTSGLPTG